MTSTVAPSLLVDNNIDLLHLINTTCNSCIMVTANVAEMLRGYSSVQCVTFTHTLITKRHRNGAGMRGRRYLPSQMTACSRGGR